MFSQNSHFPFTCLSSLEVFDSLLCSLAWFLLPLKSEYLKGITTKCSLTSVSARVGSSLAPLPFGSVECCTSGPCGQVAIWKQQPSVPTSPWEWCFSVEREFCTKQSFQLHGIDRCQMLHLNEKQAVVGCRCCLLLFLSSLRLVTPVLYLTIPVGEVRALTSVPQSRSVWWRSVGDTQRYTIARPLRNQPWDSGGGFAQGSCQSAFTYLSPNLWNCVRAAVHSQSHRVQVRVAWLQPADITHLKHCALPPVLLSRRWQGWTGLYCPGELTPVVTFLLLRWSGPHFHLVCQPEWRPQDHSGLITLSFSAGD